LALSVRYRLEICSRSHFTNVGVVGITALMAIPLLIIAFNVSKIDNVWRGITAWVPVRKRLWPSTEDKFPVYKDIARMLKREENERREI